MNDINIMDRVFFIASFFSIEHLHEYQEEQDMV
jgi:hypothetical protein